MIKLATDQIQNWIFVTGVPRSGTTFVGMNLSLPREVDYIHEPFNPQCGLQGLDQLVHTSQNYFYVRDSFDTQLMQDYHQLTKKIFTYDFNLKNHVPQNDPWKRQLIKRLIGSRGPYYLRFAKLNMFHKAAIIKDPIGCFLCEYLYLQFGVKPVIVVKHPISFIASLKRVNFWPNLAKISNSSDLVKDFFPDEESFFTKEWSDPISAASAFWRVVYKVLLTQASRYPDWTIITHEELSQKPVEIFRELYNDLHLPWSQSIESKILKQTQGSRSTDAQKGVVQDFKRNSSNIFNVRLRSIPIEERQMIFDIVHDVALNVYDEETFALGNN